MTVFSKVTASQQREEVVSLPWRIAVVAHLLPGLVLLGFFVLSAPLLHRQGLPEVWGLLIGIVVVLLPLELGIVRYATRGQVSPLRSLGLGRPNRSDLVPLVVAFVASVVLPGAVLWLEPALRDTVFNWLPQWWQTTPDLSKYSADVQLATAVLWLASAVLIGPVVEEIYFRGWLLPKLPAAPVAAVMANAALFSVYHLWQPQAFFTVFVFTLPLGLLVTRRANPILSVIVHCAVNAMMFFALFAGVVYR